MSLQRLLSLECFCLCVVRFGLIRLPSLLEEASPILIGSGIVGIELDCLTIVIQRVFEIFLEVINYSTIEKGFRTTGVELNASTEIRYSFIPFV
jgi:hypothetical protein